MYTITLEQVSKKDVEIAGGKGASLGEMIQAGFPVPSGFVITADAYKNDQVIDEVFTAFDELSAEFVAVRSSAIAEDSSKASWAGQLESYLNVTRRELISKVKDCWNSIDSPRATIYSKQQELSKNQLKVAVVVQQMIDSEASGVMFTTNPVTKDNNEIMIEAIYGLGELLVQGVVTPASYIVDKKSEQIKDRELQRQEIMLKFKKGKNTKIRVPGEKRKVAVLTDKQVGDLAELGIKIGNHYGAPQDIEYAIDAVGKIWILQSRPITTL